MRTTIGFVILHYNVIGETINCVNSIVSNIDTENYYIIIVDNNSPNHTGNDLQKMYDKEEKIIVILNTENLGFARGNNIGYKYALNILKCDFICVMNNDTLIMQKNFLSQVESEYEKSKFGVMGPRIVLKNNSDNPVFYKFPDKDFFIEELKMHESSLWQMKWRLNYFVVGFKILRNFFYKIIKKPVKARYKGYKSVEHAMIRQEDVVLHGCCIIFSKEYAKNYEEAFHPDTFLYKEEELLYLRCKEKNLPIIYNPNVLIKHLEDVATNSVKKNKRNRIMFHLENQIQSLKILINQLEKMEKDE